MNFQDKLIGILLEAAAGARGDVNSPNYDPFAGPIARRLGGRTKKGKPRRMRSGVRQVGDRLARTGSKAAWDKLNKRLFGSSKTRGTNPQAQHMVQAAMYAAQRRSQGLPSERPEDATADAARDRWRRMAPEDK